MKFKYSNKKVLIFCPHQDDEINIAGGLIPVLKEKSCDVKVVYSTNGDYFVDKKYRFKEGINSLKNLGISKENIYFLGYPDCLSTNDTHYYMSEKEWVSNSGQKYANAYKNLDYHYVKTGEHRVLNKENFILDIVDIILDEKPDIMICVDFDSHSDHRALSLSFENALGRILNSDVNYRPIVYKAFAYPTSYLGYSDFKEYLLPKTKFKTENFNKFALQNPYYSWKNRVSFDISNFSKRRFLIFNKTFQSIIKHYSQFIVSKTYSIINSDQVYFERNTNNLLFEADVNASSGNPRFLHDFMLFDCSNIMHGDSEYPVFDIGTFSFLKEDEERKITVKFKNKKTINVIKIYQKSLDKSAIKKIDIIVDDVVKSYNIDKENSTYILNNLNLICVNKLTIRIAEWNGELPELTEIELFEDNIKTLEENVSDLKHNNVFKKFILKMLFIINDFTIFIFRCLNKFIRTKRMILKKYINLK